MNSDLETLGTVLEKIGIITPDNKSARYDETRSAVYFLGKMGVNVASYRWHIGPVSPNLRPVELAEDLKDLEERIRSGRHIFGNRLDAVSQARVDLFSQTTREGDDYAFLPTIHFLHEKGYTREKISNFLEAWGVPKEIARCRIKMTEKQLKRYVAAINKSRNMAA